MTLTYICWHDACTEEAVDPGAPVPEQPLIELREIGWLIGESETSVSIAMELESDDTPARWRLHIPKGQIIERREMDLEKFGKRRRR